MRRKNWTIIKEQPWWSIIAEEWSRAKKLRPVLSTMKKPKFYWIRSLGGAHGRCWGSTIEILRKYLEHGIHGKDFLNILRHELAHLRAGKGHGEAFKNALERLEGTRWATASFPKKKKS